MQQTTGGRQRAGRPERPRAALLAPALALVLVLGPALTAAAAPRAAAGTLAAAAPAIGDARTAGYRPVAVPEMFRPWRRDTVTRVDGGFHDDQGVRMFSRGGKLWDHPVAQAQYGLANLNTYRQTRDLFYLQRARAQADRLVATRVEARGGWWYPYGFDFQLGATDDITMPAPWYSGMAQGEALSLFAQLSQVGAVPATNRAAYRTAADATFQTLLAEPTAFPWVVATDDQGYLWIQEYPQEPAGESDFTLNGHLFATLGLWDYARLSGDPRAARMFDAAVTTAVRYAPDIRNAGWASSYCLRHREPHLKYHQIHTWQLLQMQWLTGRTEPARLADLYRVDYPTPNAAGAVTLVAGAHTLRRFAKDGRLTGTRTLTLPTAARFSLDRRERIRGSGIHYRLTSGTASGWHVAENPRRAWLRGEHGTSVYLPARSASLAAGRTYAGYRFDLLGRKTASRSLRTTAVTRIPFDRRSTINGRPFVRVSAGVLKGYWVLSSLITER